MEAVIPMQDDRLPKTDELADILNEYRAKKAQDAANSGTKASKDGSQMAIGDAHSSEPDGILPSPQGEASERSDTIVIGSPENVPTAATDPIQPNDSVLSHFSSAEAEEDGSDGVSSHFSESDGDTDSSDPDDEPDPYAGLSRPKRIFKRTVNVFANASFLAKALIYVAVVLCIAAYLSYYVITIGNDLFALVTGSTEISVTIPENATEEQVAELLLDRGLIDYKWVFSLFMKHYGDGETLQFIAGEHKLNTDMNYSQLLSALTLSRRQRNVVTITFPEGYTVDEIIELFLKNGVGTREGFVEAINNYPYKHEFVRLLDETGWPETRVYRLEGYLYPDTYDFYTDTEEYLAINKLLNNFNRKVWIDWKTIYASDCEEAGYSLDDIITLASMVEAEGKTAEDFEYISYVFRNRLTHADTFPKLESDATIQYAYELAGMDREQDASKIDLNFDSPYNTYRYEGLPPGAICNAGLDAILAAIYPSPPLDEKDKEINAYFFVSNNAGKTYYSATLSGHERNKERVRQDNAAAAQDNSHE